MATMIASQRSSTGGVVPSPEDLGYGSHQQSGAPRISRSARRNSVGDPSSHGRRTSISRTGTSEASGRSSLPGHAPVRRCSTGGFGDEAARFVALMANATPPPTSRACKSPKKDRHVKRVEKKQIKLEKKQAKLEKKQAKLEIKQAKLGKKQNEGDLKRGDALDRSLKNATRDSDRSLGSGQSLLSDRSMTDGSDSEDDDDDNEEVSVAAEKGGVKLSWRERQMQARLERKQAKLEKKQAKLEMKQAKLGMKQEKTDAAVEDSNKLSTCQKSQGIGTSLDDDSRTEKCDNPHQGGAEEEETHSKRIERMLAQRITHSKQPLVKEEEEKKEEYQTLASRLEKTMLRTDLLGRPNEKVPDDVSSVGGHSAPLGADTKGTGSVAPPKTRRTTSLECTTPQGMKRATSHGAISKSKLTASQSSTDPLELNTSSSHGSTKARRGIGHNSPHSITRPTRGASRTSSKSSVTPTTLDGVSNNRETATQSNNRVRTIDRGSIGIGRGQPEVETPRKSSSSPSLSKLLRNKDNMTSTPGRSSKRSICSGDTRQRSTNRSASSSRRRNKGKTTETEDEAEDADEPPQRRRHNPAEAWICCCGYELLLCYKYCGECATPQNWECSKCYFDNNLCTFKFCGNCGTTKQPQARNLSLPSPSALPSLDMEE